jgi:hypothetical protein
MSRHKNKLVTHKSHELNHGLKAEFAEEIGNIQQLGSKKQNK